MRSFFLLALVLLSLVSCNHDPSYFYEYKALNGNWKNTDTLSFQINVDDTLAVNNLFFHLRATQKYPYNNIFLIAEFQFPKGKTIVDTLEYEMAYPDGYLMGSGGSIKESKLWYKQNVRFIEEGEYQIKLRHSTRNANEIEGDEVLKGIEEVGFSIEKISNDE